VIPDPEEPDHEEDPVPKAEDEEDEKWFIDREIIVGDDGEEFPG